MSHSPVAPVVGIAACAVLATACDSRHPQVVSVSQLAASLQSSEPPRIFDANGERTRREYGVIPGATLLPNSRDYSLELLPTAHTVPVVFYCASHWCGAAEGAAKRALSAGYRAVSVMPDGIKGWREAGLPTQKVD